MKTITRKEFNLKKKAHAVECLRREIKYIKQEIDVADSATPEWIIFNKKEKLDLMKRYLDLLTFNDFMDWTAMTGKPREFWVK